MVFKKSDETRIKGRREVKSEVLDYLDRLLVLYKKVQTPTSGPLINLILGIRNDLSKIAESPAEPSIPKVKTEEDLDF